MPNEALNTQALNIAALVHPRILATSITLPLEILRAAAQASPGRSVAQVKLTLIARRSGQLRLADGLQLWADEDDGKHIPDVLIVPAIWRNPRWVMHHEPWQFDVIDRCIRGGSWVCCVGSGSFLAAETGVLNGAEATTHWHWFDEFEHRFPKVTLRRNQLITQSGRLFCVGSVNSIADLMVYLSGLLFSRATALAIENQFSPEIRRRFSPHALNQTHAAHSDEPVMDVQILLRQNLHSPPDLSSLASNVGMTARTLSRRFKQAVGMTTGEYLNTLRVEEARSLLHHSNLSVAEIGWSVGYNNPSAFSRQFRRQVGVTPRQYRTAVRGKTFSPVGG